MGQTVAGQRAFGIGRVCRHGLHVALACIVWIAVSAAPQAQERRLALVIGNATYQHAGTLPTVAANTALIAKSLRQAGFTVKVHTDLGRRDLREAVNRFQASLSGADVALLYYSGLALGVGSKGLLVPVDAKFGSEFALLAETVDLEPILWQVQSNSRPAAVLLDPVVPNPLLDQFLDRIGVSGTLPTPVPPEPPAISRTLVSISHQPGASGIPSPPLPAEGPGLYAAILAQELVAPDARLAPALARTGRTVAVETGALQRPWFRDLTGSEIALGPPSLPPAPAAPATVDPVQITFVSTKGVNFRRGPSQAASVIRVIPAGTLLPATGRVRGTGWMQVEHAGDEGYVHSSLLREADPPERSEAALSSAAVHPAAPPPETAPEPPAAPAPAAEPPNPAPETEFPPHVKAAMTDSDKAVTRAGSEDAGTVQRAQSNARRALEAERRAERAATAASRRPKANHRTITYPQGDIYAGQVARNRKHGAGIYRFRNGDRYAGEWVSDAMSGFGVYVFADGSRYEGSFRDGQRTGQGVLRFANGDMYSGDMQGNRLDGYGEMRFANGDRYAGGFVDGRAEGYGELRYATGGRHVGAFRDGQPHGAGITFYANDRHRPRAGIWRGSMKVSD